MTAKILPFRPRAERTAANGASVPPPGDPAVDALARALLPGLDAEFERRIRESGMDGAREPDLERWLWHELLRSGEARELLHEIGALLPEDVTRRVLARIRRLLEADRDGG